MMQEDYQTNYVTNAYGGIDVDFYVRQAKQLRAEATADILSRLVERLKQALAKPEHRGHLRVRFNH